MSKKIRVENLSPKTQQDDLQQIFNQFGGVINTTIVVDHDTGQSRGFGFVEMINDNEADEAINKLGGFKLDGRELSVSESEEASADLWRSYGNTDHTEDR